MSGLETILSLTLIHSLWIAFGAWILAKLLSGVFRKSTSRRVIKIVSLIIFFSLTLATLFIQSPTPPSAEGIWFLDAQPIYLNTPLSWIDQTKIWIGQHSLLISILWVLGTVFGGLRFMHNRRSLAKCKSSAIQVTDDGILSRVKGICEAFTISRAVQVKISALIDSPMTVGILKPIIYFPTGLISGFTSEELDTILRHELTHIKHHDYLINTILVIIETLFFFNPFVLVMIGDLRREMEYVCDDEVIQVHNEFAYSRALMKLQEITISNQVAMAAKGNNSEFKNRIERMIYPNKTKFSPKVGIAILLFTTILASSAFVGNTTPERAMVDVLKQDVKQDTLKAKTLKEVKALLLNKDSAELVNTLVLVDGKPIKVIKGNSNALKKADKMMKEVQKELVKDGLLNENKTKITLMFQYSDVLQGEKTLGKHYKKYKDILNRYFPVYDSFATTRVFRYR